MNLTPESPVPTARDVEHHRHAAKLAIETHVDTAVKPNGGEGRQVQGYPGSIRRECTSVQHVSSSFISEYL